MARAVCADVRQGLKPKPATSRARTWRSSIAGPEGRLDRLSELAAELVRRQVERDRGTGSAAAALAAKAATTTIPIVFNVSEDPVKLGLVASLARPGGNATGINFFTGELTAKRLELLRELVPAAPRVAVLVNPANVTSACSRAGTWKRPRAPWGCKSRSYDASTSREIDAAFAAFVRERPDALFVGPDAFFNGRRVQLAQLAARHAVPAIYALRQYAEVGGLMSYGASVTDAWRQVGAYAGRILKGVKPADLPVMQASKFELVINAETARMLGLTVPPHVARPRRRGDRMNRREAISLLGGAAAAAWPLAARAQQGERVRRIGVLTTLPENDPQEQSRNAAFLLGLQQLGWTVGRNLRIDYRHSIGDAERARRYATELVALAPDVILATGSVALAPLLQATRSVPIVFTIVPDPVGAGFVDSLARPGGNATGFIQFEFGLSGKWLELLKEIAPGVTRAAVLREAGLTAAIAQFAALQSMAPSLRVEVRPAQRARHERDRAGGRGLRAPFE